MKRVHVKLQWSPDNTVDVGQLASDNRTTVFEYSEDFANSGLPLSPFRLPTERGLKRYTGSRTFGPLPGLFDDSLPDGWGMLLMDRHMRQQGVNLRTVTPLDRLMYIGQRGMGALTYHPATDGGSFLGAIDLEDLAIQSTEILAGDVDDVFPALIASGTSAGGARPKVVLGIKGNQTIIGDVDLPPEFEHWLIKFLAINDDKDAGRIEHAYLAMASAAGINVPDSKLFEVGSGRAYVGTRRFDRLPGNGRLHMATLSGLLEATHRAPSVDYDAYLAVTAQLTRDYREVVEAFRRMVFNVASHNRDDHTKNYSFLMNPSGEWRLSPAYDIVYSLGPGGEHTMAVDGEGRDPKRKHILAEAHRAGMAKQDFDHVIERVNEAVSHWYEFADSSGVRKQAAKEIGKAIRPI